MKLNKKNNPKFNSSIKRPSSHTVNLNFFPLFAQVSKKNMISTKNKAEESSTNKNNLNINNSNNTMHSNSSLYINFISPINKNNKNNTKNKSKKESINNGSIKNKTILTSIDNTSIIGSKEKILSCYQINNQSIKYHNKKNESLNYIIMKKAGIICSKKNSKNKKYPLTAMNSRKNSVDKKKSNKFSLQKYQPYYNKNINRNKFIQGINVNTCSNKHLMSNDNNYNSNKGLHGFSCFNNYILNSNFHKTFNKKKYSNISHFLFNNNKFLNKSIINSFKNSSNTSQVSPRASFINTNSKSLKTIKINKKEEKKDLTHAIKNKSKINEIFKNINIGKINSKNNNIINNNNNNTTKNNNLSSNKLKNNINYNNFNNLCNNFVLNNNNNNICYNNNIENILNNCQTTSGTFYNNYNININNQINNHIIYNNSNSRKKLNNLHNLNKNINKIISQSQQEIFQIKKNIKKNFTSNNSPKKLNSNNYKNKYKNNIFSLLNYFNNEFSNKNNKNNLQNKNNNIYYKKGIKRNGFRNQENNGKNPKIKSKSTEKLNMQFQIKSLKNELSMGGKKNNDKMNTISKINNNRIKSSGKISNNKNDESIKKNIYMEDSLKLTKYIKDYYKKNHEYPNTNLDFYKYGRLIGQGAFGKVNLGLNVLTGRVVAIKSFNKKDIDSPNNETMKKIIYETNLMKKLNHPNVTKILEMFEDEKYILISMEYINGGNLFSFVKKRRKLTEKISKFLFKQIILGIKHIHSKNIVHRDVKLENILINLNNTIKICDFGISKILNSPDELLHDQSGTPMYMAPEIFTLKEKGYKGFPVDIWSAGISLYIMLSGALPFSIKNENDSFFDGKNNINKLALKNVIINNEPKGIEKISDNARDLLHGLLNKDPNKRLTCDEILKHPWLNTEELNDNNKFHLFTKAEIIMLSKTYIDYRKADIEELQENFTVSNLKRDKDINNNEKNILTKSFILTPYNSLIGYDDDYEEIQKYNNTEFDDFNNGKINLEPELISYSNKVKEFNMLYELNNNNEVDNGMLINTKNNSANSLSITNALIDNSVIKTESVLCFEEEGNNNEYNDKNNLVGKKILIKNKQDKNQINLEEKYKNEILDKIEVLGYDKKYVKKCLDNNILCHATSIYFLLKNYDKI